MGELGLDHWQREEEMSFVSLRTAFVSILATICTAGALLMSASPAVAAEGDGFGVERFQAGTCTSNTPECTYETKAQFYTTAAGHPAFGITEFVMNSKTVGGIFKEPEGTLKNVRVDLPAGLSVNPEVTEAKCNKTLLAKNECPASTEVGVDELTVWVAALKVNLPLTGKVYNLEPAAGVPLELGVEVFEPGLGINQQTYLVGGVSWFKEAGIEPSGDYHEYFKINEIPSENPLVRSRLVFEGNSKGTGYLTLPSSCGPTTTMLHVESYEGKTATTTTTPPADVSECEKVPFKPEVAVEPSTTQSDKPDGATVKVLVPQNKTAAEVDSSTLQQATVTLPEGMTINPAAANGLEACGETQFGKGTGNPVACPPGSQIGTVAIEVPTLPKGSLVGNVYVGQPIAGKSPSSGEEYRIFMYAESQRYGVSVRLIGKVQANETTGQLTTIVAENPPLPFSEFKVRLENGSHTPLANPLVCGAATTLASFIPYSAPSTNVAGILKTPFTVDANGKGGACASPLAFAPAQSTSESNAKGGASTAYTLNLERPEGQPYVSTMATTLPPGLVGKVPSVPRCNAVNAAAGTCKPEAAIGTATVQVGSGATPYVLSGTVYFTVGYEGAPYGLSIVVPAEKVGPYNYGKIITRAKIEVNPSTAQVTVNSKLPTIVGGAPIRLRHLSVNVNHANYLINPTNCAALATSTTLTSTLNTSATVSTPFQVTGCQSLGFKPKFAASSSAKTSRKNGASLVTTLTMPAGQANVKSVSVTLPKKLPSRLSTLKLACLAATFAANPASCPPGSVVGEAQAVTPVLPGTMKGAAYFVSHGGAGFPDLDVVLKGSGVTVILVGNTHIKGGITHTKFLTLPDVPVKSFKLTLPVGPHSALGANGSLCTKTLKMPTTIVGQNGKSITQSTKIKVTGCPIVVTGHRVRRNRAIITVRTPSAGRITTTGRHLRKTVKTVGAAKVATINANLSARGVQLLGRKHRLSTRVHVRFVPVKKSGLRPSSAHVRVKFRG